jgi:hypothetical protein
MACGAHVGITAREKDEQVTVQTDDGKTASVYTGKKTFDSYKGMDYNVKTILRMFRDENDQVCCVVEKDRTKRYAAGTVLEDPSLLDWEEIVASGNGKKEFVIKNDLDKAIEADQKIFEKQMLGADSAPETAVPTNNDVAEIQAAIKAKVNGLNPVEKKTMKEKLTKAKLPTAFNKVTDEEVLKQILAIVSE